MSQSLGIEFINVLYKNTQQVAIVQRDSATTKDGIELTGILEYKLNEIVQWSNYLKLNPEQIFRLFVSQLATGQIIEGAYLDPSSYDIFESKYKFFADTNIKEICKNVKREYSIALDHEAANDSNLTEIYKLYDLTNALQYESQIIFTTPTDFYENYEFASYVETLNLKINPLKTIQELDEEKSIAIEDLLLDTLGISILDITVGDYQKSLINLFEKNNTVFIDSIEDIYKTKDFEYKNFLIKGETFLRTIYEI